MIDKREPLDTERLDLDGRCVLKDDLPRVPRDDPRNTQVRRYCFWVRSTEDARERFIARIQGPLEKRYGDVGDHMAFVLNEALMNAQEHAHHHDADLWSFVQLFLFPHRIVQTIQYVPTRFDPHTVRTSAWDEQGKFYTNPRGRGHIMIKHLADSVVYPLAHTDEHPPFVWELHVAKAVPEKR